MNTKPVAWSYSSLKKFLDCPRRYEEEKVKRSVKRKDTEQSLWGERVHQSLDMALKTGVPIVGDTAAFGPVAERFSQIRGSLLTEQQLAINSSLKPTVWFAPDVWCRGILDAVWIDGVVARIVDWKTGKRKRESTQLKLFALLLFAHHREVERVNTSFVWLQTGKMDVEKFHRRDVPILWQDILPDVRRLETAHRLNVFPPKPSGLCNWCPVKECSFWLGEAGEGKQRGRA